jgi:glucosamine kinase
VAYYLGVDGGGSKTTCAVADESTLLATFSAGPSNITRVGQVRARESLHEAVRQACAAAGIDPRQVQRACIGVAGAGRDEIAGAVRQMVAELIPAEIEVVGDMQIALAAAFAAGPGVLVIAGTGSIAYGRNARGATARAGGWGYAISDEGSAHWIGRHAVAGLLRTIDESIGEDAQAVAEGLPLFCELQAAWKLHSLDEFVRSANSNPDFAALFPAILAAADAGDEVAQQVLTQASRELAKLAGIVVRRLFTDDTGKLSAIPLAMAGGVFRYSPRVREVFCDEVHKLTLEVEVNPQVVEPVAGALTIARGAGARTRNRL